MKIVHLSTYDQGGAAAPMKTLHLKLLESNVQSEVLVLHKTTNIKGYLALQLPLWKKVLQRIRNKIQFTLYKKTLHDNKYFFRIDHNLYSITPKDILNSISYVPDIFYIHWVEGFANFELLNELQKKTNSYMVFAHPDMANFTGGCHYSFECNAYQNNCYPCPAIKNKRLANTASKQLMRKKKYFPQKNISVVGAPLVDVQIKNSIFAKNSAHNEILWGEDSKSFHPGNKTEIKKKYGIKASTRVLFFGAETVTDERKGFSYLIEALNELNKTISKEEKENVLLVIAGKHIDGHTNHNNIPFNQLCLNYTSDQAILVEYYQLADVFICPTINDYGPWMVFQALMCGVPIIAFKMGISAELITEDTGYIAPLKNVAKLTEGILKFIRMSEEDIKQKQLNARQLALKEISLDAQYAKYLQMLNALK